MKKNWNDDKKTKYGIFGNRMCVYNVHFTYILTNHSNHWIPVILFVLLLPLEMVSVESGDRKC